MRFNREVLIHSGVRALRRNRAGFRDVARSSFQSNFSEASDYVENVWTHVEGWLSNVGIWMLAVLLDTQHRRGIVGDAAEIGCWEGKTLLLFQRLLSREERVMGYDLELRPRIFENIDRFSWEGGAAVSLSEIDSRNLSTSQLLEDSKLGIRFFHVDGYHTREVTENDLELAFGSTKPEGIVVLDDFFSATVPGVTEAFFKLALSARTNDFIPFATGGGKLFLCSPEFALEYKRSLFSEMPIESLNSKDVSCLLGNEIAIYEFGIQH